MLLMIDDEVNDW